MFKIKKCESLISSTLIALIIFLVPSNLFIKFSIESAYVHGILSDYLIPKIFLSDIVILAFIVIGLLCTLNNFSKYVTQYQNGKKYILLLLFFVVIQQLNISSITTRVLIFKILFFALFTHLFYIKRDIIKTKYIKYSLTFTIFFQSLVALGQYATQQSLFGYWFLGEPNLSSYAGITKQMIFNKLSILPYGTTAHPNVLGGILATYMFACIFFYKRNKSSTIEKSFYFATVILGSITLFLTQSYTAWLSTIIGLFIILVPSHFPHFIALIHTRYKKNILRFCALIITIVLVITPTIINILAQHSATTTSITRRSYLNTAGLLMFQSNSLWGVGYSNFTKYVEMYTTQKEIVRFIQPAHHVGILFLAEWGIAGTLLWAILMYHIYRKLILWQKKNVVLLFLFLAPILFLDHYLYTLQSGQLLIMILFVLSISQQKIIDKKSHPPVPTCLPTGKHRILSSLRKN